MTLKEFVEEYVDMIDSRNWYELFSIIYHMLENNRYAFDLNEFFELMKGIDSSFMQDTYEERKKLIEYYIEESYTTHLHTFQSDETYGGNYRGIIFYAQFIKDLASLLGFRYSELFDIIDNTPIYGQRIEVDGRKAIDVRDLIW